MKTDSPKSDLANHSVNLLRRTLESNEEWLVGRILGYAKKQQYTRYAPTLVEAWRLSISGLNLSIINALQKFPAPPEMNPEENLEDDEISQFGVIEARRHRERGVSLHMFLGLMKYYRQAYMDLIRQTNKKNKKKDWYELFINRVFDRIEIAFCVEWSGADNDNIVQNLQIINRMMTNEKNKYLTIFETIPNPVIILNRRQEVDDMNLSAARMFKQSLVAGSQYCCQLKDRQLEMGLCQDQDEKQKSLDASCFGGLKIHKLLPWLKGEVERFHKLQNESMVFEKSISNGNHNLIFRVKFSKSIDISGKFDGIVIVLEDITSLKKALEEVKTLKGLIPICSRCKNIRDDRGFWQNLENYVSDHSEAEFSHGICPDCVKKLYPDLYSKVVKK